MSILSDTKISKQTFQKWQDLDNIKTEPESVKLFVNALFVHRTHISHKRKSKSILAATVLRFHGSFLEVIGNELSGKYKDPIHHNFHHTIMSILSDTKISKQTFQKWQDEVMMGWIVILTWRFIPNNFDKWSMKPQNSSGKNNFKLCILLNVRSVDKECINKQFHRFGFCFDIVKTWRGAL